MKNYLLNTVLVISLFFAGCATPRSLAQEENVQSQTQTHTVDSLNALLQTRELQIRELRLQLSATQKRAEQSERVIKEYDAQGNLLKTDETRTQFTTDNRLRTELSERDTLIRSLNEEIIGLREVLAKVTAERQIATKNVVTAYKVPAWCWWLLAANIIYIVCRVLWAIYGKRFLHIFKTFNL